MSRHSRSGAAGLLARQVAANPVASVLVALIVLVSAFIASAGPRALDQLFTAELRHSVTDVAAPKRDLVANALGGPVTGSGVSTLPADLAETFGAMDEELAHLRDEMGGKLRAATGEPRYVASSRSAAAPADEPEDDAPNMQLLLAVDPRWDLEMRIVQGSAPVEAVREDLQFGTVGIMLSRDTAAAMRWTVGEERTVRSTTTVPQRVVLTGLFEAVDSRSDYWQHVGSVLEPFVFDDGNATPVVTGTAFVHPLSVSAVYSAMGGLSTHAWFPVDSSGLTFAEARELLQQLRSFTSGNHPVSASDSLDELSGLTFGSGLVEEIEAVVSRASSTLSVIAMAAAGPLGVTLAVLGLATRLVIERRRAGLALAAARGASRGQLRGMMAIEGAIVGIPAAVLATIAAALLLPATVGPEAIVLPALIGIAPIALLAAAAPSAGLRTTRNDLGEKGGSRWRWIVEVVVIGLAALAIFLLLRRGLTSSSLGVDPLLAATPLLLALAVCVVVLRFYPVPLSTLEGAMRGRSGLTGYLGAARAVRDPAAGLAPVLAMVVGVSVAVFSGTMVATLDRGVDDAARATVGADLQASGPVFAPELTGEIAGLQGVTSAAGVDDAGPGILRVDGVRGTLTMLVVDFGELRALRGESILPSTLDDTGTGSIPVLASADLVEGLDPDAKLQIQGHALTIAATADRTAGIAAQSRWIMVDKAFAEELTGVSFRPRILLVALSADADPAVVATAIEDAAGPQVAILDPVRAAADIRSSPAVSGLQSGLVMAMVLVGLLSAAAVLMTSVVGARARNRLLALLATLGLSAREARGLAAWEIGPIAITAIIAGTALGIAMPWIVLAGVDLRPFTGGAAQPVISVDALSILAIVGGFAAVVLASVLVAVAIGRRVSASTTLRMGEEG